MRRVYLTERDVRVLEALSTYRFMTAEHLHALAFPTLRAAEERLRRLRSVRFVTRVYAPVSVGSRALVGAFALTRAGARAVAEKTGEEAPPHVTVRETRSTLMLHHTLRRTDVRLVFECLPELSMLQLGWRQSPDQVTISGVREFPSGRRRRAKAIPDGIVHLWHPGGSEIFIIEVDRASVSKKRMQARYELYFENAKREVGGAGGGVRVRVLTLAPTTRRLERLRAAAYAAAKERPGDLFAFATFDDAISLAEPRKILETVWWPACPTARRPHSLFPTDV